MFVPETYGFALLLMIVAMICWGSWANTFKLAGKVRFELFYWDYALGVFVMAVILALTLGSWHGGEDAFFNNLSEATGSRIALAMAAGTIFNLANILLVGAITIAGMAIAFPVAIGAALVIGTVLTYVVDRTGNPAMLFAGVGLAIVAILADSLAYKELSGGKVQVTKRGLGISIISGILMGSWSPLTAASMANGVGQLTPFTSTVVFAFATLVSTIFFNIYFMQKPLIGEPVSFEGYLQGKPSWHALGIVGGFIWTIGTAANLIAGREAGFAVSYAMGQSAPMVAAVWGVFVWKEFEGAPSKAKMYLALMFVFYTSAIAVIANAF
ncbi:MAG: GRP family sugar transporter [Acidobacteriota bacterium]|nr:MAG: GRP family sugar transporter [Acidobacteriota bacterium]